MNYHLSGTIVVSIDFVSFVIYRFCFAGIPKQCRVTHHPSIFDLRRTVCERPAVMPICDHVHGQMKCTLREIGECCIATRVVGICV